MKELTLILISLLGCSAYLIKVPTINTPTQPRIAPLGWVHIQKLLLPLFENVCEDSTNVAVVQIAKDFTLDISNGDYMKPGVVENLRNLKTSKGFLPKGEIFTEYNADHMKELKALYDVFFYARDFDTFYRVAAWARQNINCGVFVDAIYLAIVNRKDLAKLSVPAPYELLPNYFINKDVIVKASLLLTADNLSATSETSESEVRVEGNSYVLDANYTADISDGDEDSKLAYFREDIGLNAYYFVRKLRNAAWFNMPNDINNMYGERMFMMMRQFAARYDLERYSHGLPELEGFNWDSIVAYDPMLIYSNGNEFSQRPSMEILDENDDAAFVKTIENNLAAVVTHLRQAGHNKSQILGHLIEILVTSDKSYEVLCGKLMGYDKDLTSRNYGVLEHYMTTLRDPMFWRINKKMVQLINNALKVLPSYSRNELYFPGVEILSMETKKMMTSFDNFQFDVTDSLKTSTANTTFQVKIAQHRLNHKPFVMKLNVSSLVPKKGLVKIFLGPKMMPGELALKKHLFVLLDQFEVNLKRGYNVLSRSSDEMTSFSNDFVSLRALRKKVEDAEFGLDALSLNTVESQIGYPSRLILPRGLPTGLPLQVFVFIAPLTKGMLSGSSTANMEINKAVLSPGYPLDLPIEIKQLFGLPNSLVREFTVTHKNEAVKTGNGGRPGGEKPYGGGRPYPNNYNFDQLDDTFQDAYDKRVANFDKISNNDDNVENYYDDSLTVRGLLGDRPEFTYRKTDTTNYADRKNQYRKKDDYAFRRNDEKNDVPTFHYTGNKNYFDKITPVPVINNNHASTVNVHGLLGANPALNQYSKKEHVESDTTELNNDHISINKNKNFYDNYFQKNIVDDDIFYVDSLVPIGMLEDSKDVKDDVDQNGKKYQYVKKIEDRAAKREQKKEKYTIKGEQKKDEYVAKREQKKEESIYKRDKYLRDLNKKVLDRKISSKKTSDSIYDRKSESVEKNVDPVLYNDFENDKNYQQNIGLKEHIDQHKILTKTNTPNYELKKYQYIKEKEESQNQMNEPKQKELNNVKYRDEIIVKKVKKFNDALTTKDINIYEDNSLQKRVTDKKMDINILADKEIKPIKNEIKIKRNKENFIDETDKAKEFSYKISGKNLIEDLNPNHILDNRNYDYTNNKKIDEVVLSKKKTNNLDTVAKDFPKVFESKKVYKNIVDDEKSKNVTVDKGKTTKGDMLVKASVENEDESLSSSVSVEKSEEVDNNNTYNKKIDKVVMSNKKTNSEDTVTNYFPKDFVSKKVYKNIIDDGISKNVQVNKGKTTKGDMLEKTSVEDGSLSSSVSDEKSEEIDYIKIEKPITSEEVYLKPVSIYDFLLDPTYE